MQILRRLFSRARPPSQQKMNGGTFRGCLIVANLAIPQCTHYRVEQKKALLRQLHCPVTVLDWQNEEAVSAALPAYDMVIFYRVPATPPVIGWIRYAQQQDMLHYWEVDDYIFNPQHKGKLISDAGGDTRTLQRQRATLYLAALKLCGHVIASTPELARGMMEAGARSTHVIENALGEDTLRIAASLSPRRASQQDNITRIAFSAGSRNHDVNFAFIAPVLVRLLQETSNLELVIIGHITIPESLHPYSHRITIHPFSNYADYLHLLNPCDFMIVPLLDTVFNRCKSNIKFLEAAALRMPVIATPIPAYRAIITPMRNGLIAETEEEWHRALQQLTENAELRKDMGEQAYASACEKYSSQHIAATQVLPLLPFPMESFHESTAPSQDSPNAMPVGIYTSLMRRMLFAPFLGNQTDADWVQHLDNHRQYLDAQAKAAPQTPLISIILPTYNRAEHLDKAIESVLEQHYQNWELLIMDDASTDNTTAIVASYQDSRIHYEKSPQNQGPAAARNRALEKARGELICYLDSDNQFLPGFLHIMAYSLLSHPDYAIAYSAQACEVMSEGKHFIRFFPFHRPALEHDNYIDLGCIMHKRQLIQEHGAFNPAMPGLEDWELLLRYTRKKPALAVPATLTHYVYGHSENQRNRSHDAHEAMPWIDKVVFGTSLQEDTPETTVANASQIRSLPQLPTPPSARRSVAVFVLGGASPQRCIETLRHYTKEHAYHLTVLHDSATALPEESKAWLEQNEIAWVEGVPAQTFNAALSKAAEEKRDIVLLDAEAIATRGWLDALQFAAEQLPQADVIIPRQTRLAGDAAILQHQPLCTAGRECDISLSAYYNNVDQWLGDAKHGFIALTCAMRFCFYIPHAKLAHVASEIALFASAEPVQRKGELTLAYTPHSKLYRVPRA